MSRTLMFLISIYFLGLVLILLMYTSALAAIPNVGSLIIKDTHKRINSKTLKEVYSEPKREVPKINSGVFKTI